MIQLAAERGLLPRQPPGMASAGEAVPSTAGPLDPRALAAGLGLPFVVLAERRLAADVGHALPRPFVIRHLVCPAGWHNGVLQVAVADPLALDVLDGLEHVAGRPVQVCVADRDDLARAIALNFGGPGIPTDDPAGAFDSPDHPFPAAAVETVAGAPADEVTASDAPVIKLVQDLIVEAVGRRASDIHLEPLAGSFRVRYRVDGALAEGASPAKRLQPAIISRLKIMANISIAEKRVPQDGRIQVAVDGRAIDLRVSSLPTVHGESVVMRILDQQGLRVGLPELGFGPETEAAFARVLASPDGIVLVTGPTGSGKTTTLYSCLHHLNRADRKIITVEEPVEYQLTGINQVPVRAEIGMTFASALRAMLRQAPNVVMVGEIRDRETAEVSLNAALTGHLVFSTLHTNDAPGAVTRLIDLGARPFLVAAALRATVAQRLVRRVCPHCRRLHVPSAREILAAGLTPGQAAGGRFARGAGCAACRGTGYLGRTGIFEMFLITAKIRDLIGENAPAARLRALARAEGMPSLREDGLRKVLAGDTTIEEVVSATAGDKD